MIDFAGSLDPRLHDLDCGSDEVRHCTTPLQDSAGLVEPEPYAGAGVVAGR